MSNASYLSALILSKDLIHIKTDSFYDKNIDNTGVKGHNGFRGVDWLYI